MRWLKVLVGASVLAVVVWWVGPQPFAEAVRSAGPGALAAALAITAVTTLACAWRWRVLARAMGVEVSLPEAVSAYYRSQFLNATLPGGVVGDVHRAVRHGALPVVADRGSGQVVQLVAAGALLLLGPAPWAAALLGLVALVALVR